MRRRLIILISIITGSMLLYPALHETGHILAARLTGCELTGSSLFLHPHVSLISDTVSDTQALFISACGGWLPMLALLLPDKRLPYLYAVKLTIAVMGFFSGAESALSALIYIALGVPGSGDAAIMLSVFPGESATVFLTLLIQTAVSAAYLLHTHPLQRTIALLYT